MQRPGRRLLFFEREIENQKAIDARFARCAVKLVEPELEDRIQVGVEDNRHLGAAADLADAIENSRRGGAGYQGTLGGQLVYHAVRQRIGKGNA